MNALMNLILGVPTAYAAAAENAPGAGDIIGFVLQKLPLWITAAVVLVVSLALAFIFKGIVESRLASKISDEHQEALIISGRVTFIAVSIIGVTIALSIAGIDLTAMLAAIAFGISFGLQDTIANFVAGLALLASRPFTIGDWITVDGNTGKVIDIRTRATYLQTFEGMRLVVPNSTLYSSSVLSRTSNPMQRIKVPVYCRYGINLKDVIAMAMNVVKADPRIFLHPKPSVILVDFADYYVNLELRCWVDSKNFAKRIKTDIGLQIQQNLEQSGMDAPYPVTSLGVHEDAEDAVIKTKAVDPAEYAKMKDDRAAMYKEFDLMRAKMVADKAKETQAQAYIDENGAKFITAVMPPATPATATKPVLPPSIEKPPPVTTLPTPGPVTDKK